MSNPQASKYLLEWHKKGIIKIWGAYRFYGCCGPICENFRLIGALHQVQVVFCFSAKPLFFSKSQWPPIPNFLCDLCKWPQLESACMISAFYLKFLNQMQPWYRICCNVVTKCPIATPSAPYPSQKSKNFPETSCT